jgi:hypothetical protein
VQRELNRYNCFSALCSSRPGEPSEFDEAAEKWSDEGTGFISPFSRTQHELGQFLTPRHVADFMATLFSVASPEVQLLDASARKLYPFDLREFEALNDLFCRCDDRAVVRARQNTSV